jgi:hypothetical protein
MFILNSSEVLKMGAEGLEAARKHIIFFESYKKEFKDAKKNRVWCEVTVKRWALTLSIGL